MRDFLDGLCFAMIVLGIRWLSPRGMANMQEELRIILLSDES